MNTSRRPMVELRKFAKSFGKIEAVKPLDLVVETGECFALLGPNGGGKSTIIRALVGLHAPTSGNVIIGGVDAVKSPTQVKEQLAYMPQRVALPDMLTGREVVTLFAKLKGVEASRVDEVLELFALGESAERYTHEFSGGMLQRLGLAVAFLKDVPLFVLDEPALNLDPIGIERLLEILTNLKKKGATIVFATHSLQNAAQLSDRVAMIVEGKLARVSEVLQFRADIEMQSIVRVTLSHTTAGMSVAAQQAGAAVAKSNGRELTFRAQPNKRWDVIRAIERAGGEIQEFHTEVPDWTTLIRSHLGEGEKRQGEKIK